jgi:hypothetical protein
MKWKCLIGINKLLSIGKILVFGLFENNIKYLHIKTIFVPLNTLFFVYFQRLLC